MVERYLILDCDGVIFDSLPLIDQEVRKILVKASDSYRQELLKEADKLHSEKRRLEEERADLERINEIIEKIQEIEKLRQIHYFLKDYVLEEVCPHFKGRINYREIYKKENLFPRVINSIELLWKERLFTRFIVLSQVNPDSEIEAKSEFFKENLPMVEFVPVRFHLEPRFDPVTQKVNKIRKPSDKILELIKLMIGERVEKKAKELGVSPEDVYKMPVMSQIEKEVETILANSYFIDDTGINIENAEKHGVGHCYYRTPDIAPDSILKDILIDVLSSESKKGKRN